jgi:membrane-associated HD superfamily phosphohydrolase
VYVFPKKGQFKYEYRKGQAWEYENLRAPFDFAILKTEKELSIEKKQLKKELPTYFNVNSSIQKKVESTYTQNFATYFTFPVNSKRYKRHFEYGLNLIDEIYSKGILPLNYKHEGGKKVSLIKDHAETEYNFDQLLRPEDLLEFLNKNINSTSFASYTSLYYKILFESIEPNLKYDIRFNEQQLEAAYSKLSISRDLIPAGNIIITKGELIDATNFQELESLKLQYDTRLYTVANIYWILLGILFW